MKKNRLFVSLPVLIFAFGVQAQTEPSFDCTLLVGNWVGEYRYEDGQLSRWRASYSEDNSLAISFYDEQQNEVGRQTGTWDCDGQWVKTRMQENGQSYSFEYRIKALDIFRYVYESAIGPVFTSYRQSSVD